MTRLSLTTRLTLFYTLISALVLLGLGWLTSVAMNQHFNALDRAGLQDKIHLIEEVSAKADSKSDLKKRLSDVLHSHEGLIVTLESNGETLFATEALKIPDAAIKNLNHESKTQKLFNWETEKNQYRALGALISTPLVENKVLTLWVVLDSKLHAHFQEHFRFTLAVYVILATIFSGLLGWLAAKQGLAPLRIMKSKAQAVTSNKMGERMPVKTVPVEMADLAQTLNDMLDRLQEDFSRLSEFSSDLAHELRTPISNLLTETQVTLSSKRSNAEYEDVLASNSEELQRLARMVSDMLFLAKTENGLALPHQETITIATEAQALFDFYEALAFEREIYLELTGDAIINSDRLMLRRALSNLLSNALRHAAISTTVSIKVETLGDKVQVRVINRGSIIDEEMLPRLFDRFFRVDKSRAHPHSDGAGLGLAITRAIMLAHGGSVTVTSLIGETCFTLTFPKVDVGNQDTDTNN
jgi:two-component system heavy metal sensor histidine kinase CusS